MKLYPEDVLNIARECLAVVNEDTDPYAFVIARGVVSDFLFWRDKLEEKGEDIKWLLSELPDDFHAGLGGGMSFFNACLDKDGIHWTGEHRTVEVLMCLGLAIGCVEYCLPEELWSALPGGMPYFVVKDCKNLESRI